MSTSARLKLTLARNGRAIALALVVVAVVGAAGAYLTYTSPSTETVTETRNRVEVATATTTSAVVTGNTSLYEQGERLEQRSVYLLRASPEMQLTVRTDVPEDRKVTVRHELLFRSTASRDGEPFWSATTPIIDNETVTRSGSVTVSDSINMSAVQDVRQRQQTEVDVGIFQSEFVLRVTYTTPRYEGTIEALAPVTISGGGYWLEAPLEGTNSHSESVSRTVVERDMFTVRLFGLVAVLALLGAVGVAYWHAQGPDVAAIESELSKARYEEWISEGQFPTDTEKQFIYINTLEDLVDVAIDSSKRVIYDPDLDAYSVLDGDLVYYHATEPTVISSWLDLSE
jgi:flagellar basal body-associated protein FliL